MENKIVVLGYSQHKYNNESGKRKTLLRIEFLGSKGVNQTMTQPHRLKPGHPIRLAEIPTEVDKNAFDKEAITAEFEALRQEFIDWQVRLYAEGKQKLLVVFQAMDAGGKDGATRAIFEGVNPQGVEVTSFKVPTIHELAHDFLWRTHAAVPAKGMIGVFNRSHYEDVLVVRVENIAPESVWRPRFEHINAFEKLLTDSGTKILKFFLHISKDEQKERLEARLKDPSKYWKFEPADLEKRKLWEGYMAAYEEAFALCTTPWAPWFIIPSNQKWYRNWAIMHTIVEALREMNPQFPPPKGDWSRFKVE